MKTTILAGALALAALTSMTAAASAQATYGARPLTVTRHAQREVLVRPVAPVEAYNPYVGPKALITAPLAVASTIVSLPFRVTDAIFARSAGTPFALVGTPLHLAGRVAQAPFRLVEAPFGGPAPFGETPNYY